MAEFTLLKIQLDESSVTANAPFGGREEPAAETESPTEESTDAEGGALPLLLVASLGLLALAAVAVVLKKRRGAAGSGPTAEDDEELVELDDIDA